MFKFRRLKRRDFPQMLEWLSRDHVKQWWNDGDDTLEKVAVHYNIKEKDVSRFILFEQTETIEKLVGYFQFYIVSDGKIGIDQFIGEIDYVNRGVGEKTIKMFIELIKQRFQLIEIILDPSPENQRAIRCYEKIGFKYYETKMSEDNQFAYMMRLEVCPRSV